MAVDRNTIVTLNKKAEGWFLHRKKSCIFAMKLFGRWLKSSRKLVKHATDQVGGENEQTEWSVWWKIKRYERKVEKEFTSFCCKNGCSSRNQSNFNASNPQIRPQNQSLQNAEKAWTFNHSWTDETWQMSTHWISWKTERCPIWCSMMKINLTFNNA